jgi:hypothetical protein
MSSPSIYTAPAGPLIRVGQVGEQFVGDDISITAPAVAVTLRPAGDGADIPAGATSAANQIMSPSADIVITLPDSVLVPGKDLYIRNDSPTDNNLTLTRHANDGGAVLGFLGAGEEIRLKSAGTVALNWEPVDLEHAGNQANNRVAALAAAVTLGGTAALSKPWQTLVPTADRVVTMPLSDDNPGRWFGILNGSLGNTASGFALVITPDAGDAAAPTVRLGPGDLGIFVSVPGTGFLVAGGRWGNAVADQAALAGAKTLTQSDEVNQFLDPGGVDRVINLPTAVSSPYKYFRIRNTETGAAGILLDVTAGATDQNAIIASLFPGDEVLVFSTGVAGAGANQGWQIANTYGMQGYASYAIADGATESLVDEGSAWLRAVKATGAGASLLRLPAASVFNSGRMYFIELDNRAGGNGILSLTDSAGGALTPAVNAASNSVLHVMVKSDGAAWQPFPFPVFQNGTDIPDPGDGVAIPVSTGGSCALTVGAGVETRTLAIPAFIGQEMNMTLEVDGGGTIAVTVAAPFNVAGNTVITFGALAQYTHLKGVNSLGGLVWQLVVNDGPALS